MALKKNSFSRLKGKIAFITGAAQGIGKEIAVQFAAEGAKLFITDIQENKLDLVSRDIQKELSAEVFSFPLDVSHWDQVNKAVDEAIDKFGRIDILVNNAGVCRTNRVVDIPEEEWDFIMDVNLKGTFLCSKAVVKSMIQLGIPGRIINIASIMARIGEAEFAAYTASKHGVLGFTRCLAFEMAPFKICVNAICPGYVDTEMEQKLEINLAKKNGRPLEEIREGYIRQVPLARYAQPADVARLAVFLASDESSFITGQGINVCGGIVMS